ncbi:MAG TPA: GntR family transcriptional regulator [Anaerolineales bacterium]|nr:GntR family transcriptional regulator [Anaerolineales bacterium]
MQKVDRNSPLPLHYQLKQHLLEKIESGEWKSNDLIPSEQELQDTFGLSRITVRQALSDLVYEGLLIRERGRGTFVAPPKMTHSPDDRRSLTEFMLEQGITPGWKVIEKGFVEANKEVAANLKLPHKTRVYRIRRLRLAADEAIGQHTAYLTESVSSQINEANLLEGGSLNYISHIPQMTTSHATRSIEAVAASDLDVKLLHMTLGSPVLMIQRVVTSASGEPLEFLQARYRGDRFKYQIGD